MFEEIALFFNKFRSLSMFKINLSALQFNYMTSCNYLVGGKLKIWIYKQAIDTEPDYQVILLCCYISTMQY